MLIKLKADFLCTCQPYNSHVILIEYRMILHIFNPEHDMSLAHNISNYTPSRAALRIRNDLAFLPYIWAKQGDAILVNNKKKAIDAINKLKFKKKEIVFVDVATLSTITEKIETVIPWGWDCTIKEQLKRLGVSQKILPTDDYLARICNLSNRKTAVHLLSILKSFLSAKSVIGESYYIDNLADLYIKSKSLGNAVIKAPWSGSGRGLRFTDKEISTVHLNWAKNIIAYQNGIILEPYYNKVQDFAMEFYLEDNKVNYCGLSIFSSLHGAYTGSLIDSEEKKRNLLGQYIETELLDTIKGCLMYLLNQNIKDKYKGPLGIDMMIVGSRCSFEHSTSQHYYIHPLVEVNFRRTMGHVALSLYNEMQIQNKVMQITFNGLYHTLEINDDI